MAGGVDPWRGRAWVSAVLVARPPGAVQRIRERLAWPGGRGQPPGGIGLAPPAPVQSGSAAALVPSPLPLGGHARVIGLAPGLAPRPSRPSRTISSSRIKSLHPLRVLCAGDSLWSPAGSASLRGRLCGGGGCLVRPSHWRADRPTSASARLAPGGSFSRGMHPLWQLRRGLSFQDHPARLRTQRGRGAVDAPVGLRGGLLPGRLLPLRPGLSQWRHRAALAPRKAPARHRPGATESGHLPAGQWPRMYRLPSRLSLRSLGDAQRRRRLLERTPRGRDPLHRLRCLRSHLPRPAPPRHPRRGPPRPSAGMKQTFPSLFPEYLFEGSARLFTVGRAARYFDLESPATRDVLRQPSSVLESLTGLVVIDEVQRMPELFRLLRIWSDRRPLPAWAKALDSRRGRCFQQDEAFASDGGNSFGRQPRYRVETRLHFPCPRHQRLAAAPTCDR